MLSYITSFFNYLFVKNPEDDDEKKEDFLAEQLFDLEESENQCGTEVVVTNEIPRNTQCFQRTGLISYIDENHILIDGRFYFELSACSLNLNLKDKILYLGYKDSNESIVVVRILENYGLSWADEEDFEESEFKVVEHVIIGEVDYRQDRNVYMKNTDLKFNLDNVEATMIPIKGDWLEMKCKIQLDEDSPSDITAAQVLEVITFKPLRSKVKSAFITDWSGDSGTCDRQIYINRQCLQVGTDPKVGSKVLVEAIESNQGKCTWRAIKLILIENNSFENTLNENNVELDSSKSLTIEKELNIEVTHPLKFEKVYLDETSNIPLNITNNSDQIHVINKWIVLSKKKDSQLTIDPVLSRPYKLYPGKTFTLNITCLPKFLGNTKEQMIIMFKGFKVERYIQINIVDDNLSVLNTNNNKSYNNLKYEYINKMKNIRNDDRPFVPGVKPIKPPAFVPARVGVFPIPDRLWTAVLGDSNQTVYSSDFEKIVNRIETNFPCLLQDLNISNYIDRWHALLYMEEIQANLNIRVYDMPKVFLIRCQEYLGVEINGLSERRPSLVKGDRVIVKDIWDNDTPKYEGYIHGIKGDLILMKFHQHFHESYSGSDVSIEFHFNRATYRRCHQALNLALSNLGPDILFPSRIISRPYILPPEKLESIQWFNKTLNTCQKAAISNILLAECRPMPYCIYGPPGTGKSVTVIETILQILTFYPDSRILVATPSNSASNLIAERLIQYADTFPKSIIRLIAHHLVDSDNIPDVIRPYCASMDIATADTVKSRHVVKKGGVNLNCPSSFIGRHRVTIGTCYCLGTLAQMELPRGHFTHIIVDEAGQATEPEIMIPMTFTDKLNGQVILAGDPMQLGPVIMSKYCREFGMEESYLCRVLDTFPYQKDFDAFENGFNSKLVTKLNYNYRSLEEVFALPNQMFYDGSLVAKRDRTEPMVLKILSVISEMFDLADSDSGGIYVYGIRGFNMRAKDSPSWYNPQEASMVALTACKLYKKNITVDEIGIITPYIAQIKYIRVLFDAMGLPQPKIGTVEEFQGQERPIVIISTVRSTESLLKEDYRNTLGFVKNPKRLNVALTRAQVAVLLFCNPHLLCKDPLWHKVVSTAVTENKYMGCDLPCL